MAVVVFGMFLLWKRHKAQKKSSDPVFGLDLPVRLDADYPTMYDQQVARDLSQGGVLYVLTPASVTRSPNIESQKPSNHYSDQETTIPSKQTKLHLFRSFPVDRYV